MSPLERLAPQQQKPYRDRHLPQDGTAREQRLATGAGFVGGFKEMSDTDGVRTWTVTPSGVQERLSTQ